MHWYWATIYPSPRRHRLGHASIQAQPRAGPPQDPTWPQLCPWAPSLSRSHTLSFVKAKNKPVSPKDICEETRKSGFIKPWPLGKHFFTTLGEDRDSGHSEARWLSRREALVDRAVSHTSFLRGTPLYRKQHVTDRPWLFRLGYLTDTFSKISELSGQGNRSGCQWSNLSFQGENKILETLYPMPWARQLPGTYRLLWQQVWFCGIIQWECHRLEECLTQRASISQTTGEWRHKISHR